MEVQFQDNKQNNDDEVINITMVKILPTEDKNLNKTNYKELEIIYKNG